MNIVPKTNIAIIITALILSTGLVSALGNDDPSTPAGPAVPSVPAVPAVAPVANDKEIVIQTVEPDGKSKRGKEVAWLGVAVEEASEALDAQLGLKSGQGLTITVIAPGSPAAKADLRKHDVLVDLDDQMLVHPHQLRKLVQMRADGDTVKLTYYRGGKEQTTSVKLGKTSWKEVDDMDTLPALGNLKIQLSNLQDMQGDMREMQRSLERAGMDKAKVDLEVKRTMEQTHRALEDAVRRASTSDRTLASAARDLDALASHGVDVDNDATVIVRNKHDSIRTIVETDETGSYIIEAGKKTRLTARDHHGKLLFEGHIDTPEERGKVPKEVWEKVKPMLDQITAPSTNEPKEEDNSGEKPNSRNKMAVQVS
jgi:PDZ domain